MKKIALVSIITGVATSVISVLVTRKIYHNMMWEKVGDSYWRGWFESKGQEIFTVDDILEAMDEQEKNPVNSIRDLDILKEKYKDRF